MNREPLWTVAGLTAAAAAVVAVLVAFEVPLTDEQQIAVLGLVSVLAPTVVALIGRGLVTPNGSVAERVKGGRIIAGAANDLLPAGQHVRNLGEAPPRRAIDADGDGAPDVFGGDA